MRGGDTEHQTRRGKDAVIRAQYRRAQPADASRAVPFLLRSGLRKSASDLRPPISSLQPIQIQCFAAATFDDLGEAHVAEQREQQDRPVQARQMREAQRRGQRGIRQPAPKP